MTKTQELETSSEFTASRYSLVTLKEDIQNLVEQGRVSRHQSLHSICAYLPASNWIDLTCKLEEEGYLLRDRISDLLSHESWSND